MRWTQRTGFLYRFYQYAQLILHLNYQTSPSFLAQFTILNWILVAFSDCLITEVLSHFHLFTMLQVKWYIKTTTTSFNYVRWASSGDLMYIGVATIANNITLYTWNLLKGQIVCVLTTHTHTHTISLSHTHTQERKWQPCEVLGMLISLIVVIIS